MNFPSNNHPAMRRCFFMAFMFANIYIGAKLSASRALSDTATTTTDDARNINNKNNNNYADSSSNDSINVMSHETSSITRLRSKAQTPATATADDDLHYQFLFSEYYAAVTSELSERESRMMDRWLAPFASKMEDQDPSFQKQKLRLVQTMLRYLETYKRGNKKNNNHGDNNNKNDDRINNYFGSNDSNGMNDNYYPKHKGGESRNLKKKKERKKKKNEKNPSPTSQPTPNPTPKSKSGKTGDDSLFPNKLKWPATDIYTTSNPITSGSTQYASTTTQFNYLKDFDLKANGTNIEIWLAKDLKFPDKEDCRNQLKSEKPGKDDFNYLMTEFDNVIYPIFKSIFEKDFRLDVPSTYDGNQTEFNTTEECKPWTPDVCVNQSSFFDDLLPGDYYTGIPTKLIVLVDNIRDTNYYNPNIPPGKSFIKGVHRDLFVEYTHRLVVTIDSYDWLHRLGGSPPSVRTEEYENCSISLENDYLYHPSPYDVEGSLSHEFHRLLSIFSQFVVIGEDRFDKWVSYGMADYYGRFRMNYMDSTLDVEDVKFDMNIKAFLGFAEEEPYFGGPEQSLSMWGDLEGEDAAKLADSGISFAFWIYLHDLFEQNADFSLDSFSLESTTANLSNLNVIVEYIVLLDQDGEGVGLRTVLINFLISLAVTEEVLSQGTVVEGRMLTNNGNPASPVIDNVTLSSIPHSRINWNSSAAYENPGAPTNGGDFVRLRDNNGNFLSAGEIKNITFGNAAVGPVFPKEWYLDNGTDPFIFTSDENGIYNAIVREFEITGMIKLQMGYKLLFLDSVFFVKIYDTETRQFVYLENNIDSTTINCGIVDVGDKCSPDPCPCVTYGPGNAFPPTIFNAAYVTKTVRFDASAFVGKTVNVTLEFINPHNVPDRKVRIFEMEMNGMTIEDALDLSKWKSYTEVYPTALDWHVSLVAYTPGGDTVWVSELPLDEEKTALVTASSDPPLLDLIGGDRTIVAAIVSVIDLDEELDTYLTYELHVNGHLQPGGS